MIPAKIIACKRDGGELSEDDIAAFVLGFAAGTIPDYQMAALAMAICIRGMSTAETVALTKCMLHSGKSLSWHDGAPKVDKHSTGGLGDKVSLVLAPILACCGVQVPMISGRGLGITGGTLDKLESIPGFNTNLTIHRIQQQTETIGCVIAGASEDLAPADRKLYALRDVTATVESIPLITASIMSKKLAESLDSLVLDVKFGSGAFMPTIDQARQLAESLVNVGNMMGVRTSALLTDMNQPLGRMIGNANECNESIETLSGNGPGDLVQLVLALGSELLVSAGIVASTDEVESLLGEKISNGMALDKLRQMVAAQEGDLTAERPLAPANELLSRAQGFIRSIDGRQLGLAVIQLGGGRKRMSDTIDHSVGIEMLVRVGDHVEVGQPLVRVFSKSGVESVQGMISDSFEFAESADPLTLIHERIS